MSNLVPDPGDRNDSQLTPNNLDSPNLYFRDLNEDTLKSLNTIKDLLPK